MPVSIETPRLLLRSFAVEDAKKYFNITRDKEIRKYLPGLYCKELDEAIKVIQETYIPCDCIHDWYLLIEEKSSQEIVGFIEITQIWNSKDYSCCYFISKSHRKNGFMKEALPAFLNAVYRKDMTILFVIEADNIASQNVVKNIPGIKELYSYPECTFFDYKGGVN